MNVDAGAEVGAAPTVGDARVEVVDVSRRFGTVKALDGVTLTVGQGEFLTLLGPSGCGKSTLLRIIGGFDRPTSGTVRLSGRDVTRLPANRRPVNMVFQRPTLFPHLDVAGNVAFGPRIARMAKPDMKARVDEALALVRLSGYQDRRAHELSGGQLQRVALARAIVNRPDVLLLDEPLSALDLKIRLEMEEELRRLHRELGGTFVYVTHDQREALALSDRIAVFSAGRVEQVGTPDEVYNRPATPFVARLVGNANVVAVEAEPGDEVRACVRVGGRPLLIDGVVRGAAWLVLRPENVRVRPATAGDEEVLDSTHHGVTGTVADVSFRGTGFSYRISVTGLAEPLKAEVAGGRPLPVGDDVAVEWPTSAATLLARPPSQS
ncbi:MAG: ABC transporter ATP-binding protein [Ilumatobacteraceae bacterium]